jgi:hypothetical protein
MAVSSGPHLLGVGPQRLLYPRHNPAHPARSRIFSFISLQAKCPFAIFNKIYSETAFTFLLKPRIVNRSTQNVIMKNMNHRMQIWAGGFAVLLAVALINGCSSRDNNSDDTDTTDQPVATPARPAPAPAPAPAPPAAVTPPVRIKAGVTEKMTDSAGNVWLPDQGFADGQTYALTSSAIPKPHHSPDQGFADGQTYAVTNAAVTNTLNQALYRSERYSMTAYRFLVPNGKYTVKLQFAEIYTGITGPGGRVFSFNVQGHEFKDFDIWVKAGGFGKAYAESVDVEVTDGKLNITFTPKVENPKVCGIEILPRN